MSNQNFRGPTGPVAGRDIIIHPQPDDPESKKQADFYRNTGIWCPNFVREILEFLMAQHGFTSRELRRAWKANSIISDEERESIKIVTPLLEAISAWFYIALASSFFLLFTFPFLISGDQHNWRIPVAIISGSITYLGMIWLITHNYLFPRRVAIRVRAKLGLSESNCVREEENND